MRFLSRFPIELYVVFFPFLIIILILYSTGCLGFLYFSGISLFVEPALLAGLDIIFIYCFIKGNIMFFGLMKKYERGEIKEKDIIRSLGYTLRSALFWTAIIIFPAFAFIIILNYIFVSAAPHTVAYFGSMFMSIDRAIFGTYPPFAIQSVAAYPPIGFLSVLAYKNVATIASLVLVIALFKNTRLFRIFLMSFMISGLIGLMFWAVFPAISPQAMYLDNTLNLKIPKDITQILDTTVMESNAGANLPMTSKLWNDSYNQKWLAVSTMPSAHIMWGLIIIVIGGLAFRPILLILVPWFALNAIGTMLTLQHYAVDIIVGVVLALVSLALSFLALKFEKTYSSDQNGFIKFLNMFENDGHALFLKMQNCANQVMQNFKY